MKCHHLSPSWCRIVCSIFRQVMSLVAIYTVYCEELIFKMSRLNSVYYIYTTNFVCAVLRRWVDDVVTSVSAMAKVDASSLQNPSVWETTASLSPCPTENDSNTTTSCFLPLQQEGSETSGDVVESRGIAITPENQAGTLRAIQDKKLHAIQRAKAASALEALSAGKRNARVESFALLIQRGLESRWTEFWRVEMERTWMTAEALELSSVQWARRQCEEAHAVWSTWRSRAKSYSAQQVRQT